MADDPYFRTEWVSIPGTRFGRAPSLGLQLIPDWTVLADDAGHQLPPQRWAAAVSTAMVTALEEAEGFIEDGPTREQLVLRMVVASAADSDGEVLARAFEVNEFCVLGLTIAVAAADTPPSWLDSRRGFGPGIDELAMSASAEPTILGSPTVPRYLRLAKDLRTGDASWDLLAALAAQDRPDGVKWAELEARSQARLDTLRNPPLVEEEAPEQQSAELWLRFLVPVPHRRQILTLTFCGYGDEGFGNPLGEACRRTAELTFGRPG